MTDIASISVAAGISQVPGARELLDALAKETGLGIAVFGGTIRDLVGMGEPGHDLDILVFGDSQDQFKAGVAKVAAQFSAKLLDYANSHIVLVPPTGGATFDVHYPKKTFLEGLVRSDFTVNGIGFLWKEQRIEDPFGGIQHLQERKLVMHSPQYVVTNPPNFPRMFRTAAKLGFLIEGETEQIIRRCANMVSLHEGRTNLRTIFEFLKFLSLETVGPYLRQMHSMRFIEGLFPELTVPAMVGISPKQTILDRNVEFAAMMDSAQFSDDLRQFMVGDLGLGISNRGILRLITFFLDLGGAYAAFKPEAPYIKAVSNGDLQAFTKRIEQNLLSHIASRHRESKEVQEIFTELPHQLAFIREMIPTEKDAEPPEPLSTAGKVRTQILLSGLRSLRKKP